MVLRKYPESLHDRLLSGNYIEDAACSERTIAMTTGHLGPVIRYLRTLADRPASDVTDGQLLERFRAQRDQAAFSALVQRHGRLVWGVCRHLLHDHHDAEDAFQATFLVLVRQ